MKLRPIVPKNKEHDFKKYVRWFGYFLWIVMFFLGILLLFRKFL